MPPIPRGDPHLCLPAVTGSQCFEQTPPPSPPTLGADVGGSVVLGRAAGCSGLLDVHLFGSLPNTNQVPTMYRGPWTQRRQRFQEGKKFHPGFVPKTDLVWIVINTIMTSNCTELCPIVNLQCVCTLRLSEWREHVVCSVLLLGWRSLTCWPSNSELELFLIDGPGAVTRIGCGHCLCFARFVCRHRSGLLD